MADSKIVFKGETSSVDRALSKIKNETSKVGKSLKTNLSSGLGSVTSGLGDISKMTASASSSLAGMGANLAKLGPLGIAAGAAIAAVGAGISNSQALSDMFAKKWEQIKSVLGVVGKAIGALLQGNFEDALDTISNGFGSAWDSAGKYADALDACETNTITFSQQQSRLNQQMSEQRAIIADTTKSEKERIKAQKELSALNAEFEKAANKQAQLQQAVADAYVEKLLSESGQASKFNEAEKARLKDYLTAVNGTIDDLQTLGGKWASVFDKISDSEYRDFASMQSNANATMQLVSDTIKTNLKAIQKDVKDKPIQIKAEVSKEVQFAEGSIGAIEKAIADKRIEMKLYAPNSDKVKELQAQIDELNAQLDPPKIKFEYDEGTIGAIKQQISELNKQLENTVYNSEAYTTLKQRVDELNASIETTNASTEQQVNNAEGLSSTFGSASSALNAFSSESEEAALAQQSLAIAEQMAAMASAIHTASGGDPYTVVARIIAAGAAIVATFASMSKAKFAGGGIVGGNRYAGDTQLIRANSGEMILNSSQQARLWNTLQNGGSMGNQKQEIRFTLRGNDIKGALSNTNRGQNRLK